jgi:DNA-binding response OmpR family regulator
MKGNSTDTYTITLDDDVMVHQIIERSTKIKTVGMKDPEELLSKIEDLHPIAVFIDIHLGTSRTGLEILPNLRTAWPFCPILVITGTPAEHTIVKALNSGADDFIRKPLIPHGGCSSEGC